MTSPVIPPHHRGTLWYRFVSKFTRIVFFGPMGGITVKRIENLPVDGPVLLTPVHISFIDPPLLGSTCPRALRFMAKEELFKFPLGPLIRSVGAFPVRRGETDTSAIRMAIDELKAGHTVLMFPEGTRNDGEQMLPIQPGIAMLAKRSAATIVPVGLAGTHKMWPRGQKLPKRAHLTISYGPGFKYEDIAEGLTDREARQVFADELGKRIAEATADAGLPIRIADRS